MIGRFFFPLFLALALLAGPAFSQQYPTKVITMIIPFAAGGPTDTVGRLVARAMGDSLKSQIIIEDVAGAGGTIAAAGWPARCPTVTLFSCTILANPPPLPFTATCLIMFSLTSSPSAWSTKFP